MELILKIKILNIINFIVFILTMDKFIFKKFNPKVERGTLKTC